MRSGGVPDLLYIAGAGHSGSSLLDVLLGSHPEIVGMGEMHRFSLAPDTRRCSCGEMLTECEFWSRVRSRVGGRSTSLARVEDPLRRIPTSGEVITLASRHVAGMVSRLAPSSEVARLHEVANGSLIVAKIAAEVSGARLAVDSSKNALRLRTLLNADPSGVAVVHLVRDGRAVVASAMRREGIAAIVATQRWHRANMNTHLVLRDTPRYPRAIRVRYEDLCADPAKVLGLIGLSIGIDLASWTPWMRPEHQIPGNPMLRSGPALITLDERWRSELGEADLDDFQEVGGKLNASYGYGL